jgi:hypothetical protein
VIHLGDVWVPQMLAYCELIADDHRLLSAFDQKSGTFWTSVTGYDELIEQIFDDLDAEGMLQPLERSDVSSELKSSLETFVRRLSAFDHQTDGSKFDIRSVDWRGVRAAAEEVVAASRLGMGNAKAH